MMSKEGYRSWLGAGVRRSYSNDGSTDVVGSNPNAFAELYDAGTDVPEAQFRQLWDAVNQPDMFQSNTPEQQRVRVLAQLCAVGGKVYESVVRYLVE